MNQEEDTQKQLLLEEEDDENEIVTLNVGGKLFQTTKQTLVTLVGPKNSQHHYFSAMFLNNFTLQRDKNGNIFIDRDGTHFRYFLNYLRAAGDFSKCSFPIENEQIMEEILIEARYYGFQNLIYLIGGDNLSCYRFFDESHCGKCLKLDENLQVLSKKTDEEMKKEGITTQYGIIRSKNPLLMKGKLLTKNNANKFNYYEVKILKKDPNNFDLLIGVCTQDCNLDSKMGNDKLSVGFDGNYHVIYGCKELKAPHKFGEGDHIGVWFNPYGYLKFFKNKKNVFKVEIPSRWKKNQKLYFAVCIGSKNNQVQIIQDAQHPELEKMGEGSYNMFSGAEEEKLEKDSEEEDELH